MGRGYRGEGAGVSKGEGRRGWVEGRGEGGWVERRGEGGG